MVDLLDNFLDLMKISLAVTSDSMKSLQWRMGGGKERKMTGGSAAADHVKDRRKSLKRYKTYFMVFRVLSKHTLYVQ